MPKLNERVPLVEDKADHEPMLRDLQCNILSSHGRPNTHYFLLRFRSRDPDVVRSVLRGLAEGSSKLPQGVKCVSEFQSRARRIRKKRKKWALDEHAEKPVSLFPTLILSARCYQDFLKGFKPPSDPAFNRDLADRERALPEAVRLNDRWNPESRGAPFHAIYMVGYAPKDPNNPKDAKDPDKVDWSPVRDVIYAYLEANGVDVREECGYVLRHPIDNYPIEPFGYRDAISQPKFFWEDHEKQGAEGVVQDEVHWPSLAPLSTVLVKDPNGGTEQSSGTYVVYRKLMQKVAKFYAQAERLAKEAAAMKENAAVTGKKLTPEDMKVTPEEIEDVADGLIGRRVTGDPLDPHLVDPHPNADKNDFKFPADSVCPMHAHVRKVNPREGYALGNRIVRRSTVYGPPYQRKPNGRPVLDKDPTIGRPDGVGLMFFCCQSNIAEQFETIQGQWANARAGGADTVIAQLPLDDKGKPELNKIGVSGSGMTLRYEPVVELLEGEYFFAPSISFFSKL